MIKVEGLSGDPMRNAFGPPGAAGLKAAEGKESIAVDLKNPLGLELVRRLAAGADMVVVGFRPGVVERLGLGYEDLKAINPNLSYVYVAGYGLDGPCANRATYGPMNAAVAGDVARQAAFWLNPARSAEADLSDLPAIAQRLARPGDVGDPLSALGAAAVLAMTALAQRRCGGQFVVNTQIASNAYAFSDDFCRYDGKPALPDADCDQFGYGPTYRLYETRRGWIFLACITADERSRLVEELHAYPAVAGASAASDDELLAATLASVFRDDDASAWESRLLAAGVGCVEVFEGSLAEFACDEPRLRNAGLTVEVEDPRFGPILRHGPTVVFSDTQAMVGPACVVGQHTRSILLELGYGAERIDQLVADGVVTIPSHGPSPSSGTVKNEVA